MPTQSKRILEHYNLFGFHQLIRNATRETINSATLIDYIATTYKLNVVEAGVHKLNIRDQYLIYCVRKVRGSAKKMHKSITTRQMKTFNKERFLNDLVQVDLKVIASHSDEIDLVVDQWTTVFSIIPEKHAAFRDRRVRDRFCPWVTKDLRKMLIVRDRLKKQAIRSKSPMLMAACKQMRNSIQLKIQLKRIYFANKIALLKGDIKGTWKTINSVLIGKSKTTNITSLDIEGKRICDNKNIAESLNQFFCNIGINLSKDIPNTENTLLQDQFPINIDKASFNFRTIRAGHIEQALGKRKTSAGFGADGIASQFVKI